MAVYSCLACGHIWKSRVAKSRICPNCKKYLYVRERQLKAFKPSMNKIL